VQAKLFLTLDEPERLFIERMIESYLKSDDATSFRPTLLHGDLSPDHVLFDLKAESVTAIIDFGDAVIGDRAWDFLFIYEDYGLDFLSRVLTTYGETERLSLLRRIYQFYLIEAMDWYVGLWLNGGDLTETIAHIRTMRVEETQRFDELLSACREI
jgi:aminoglycoside 2''-phosphotransferase